MSITNGGNCDSNSTDEVDNNLTILQRLYLADGTVSAPSATFTNDTNTGLYRPGSDQLALVTNGVTRASVSNSGLAATDCAISNSLTVMGAVDCKSTIVAEAGVDCKSTLTVGGESEFKAHITGDTADFGGVVSTGALSSSSLETNAIGATNISLADGVVASPAVKFANDPATGIYRVNGGEIGITSSGANAIIVGATTTIYSADTYVGGRFNIRPSVNEVPRFRWVNNNDDNRWLMGIVDAESSGNAGSNLVLQAEHDDNSLQEYLRIRRSDGLITGNFNVTLATSGSYTPTFYPLNNFTTATNWIHHYHRIGNMVSVHGTCQVQMTALDRYCDFYISLPFQTTFTAITQLSGTGVARELTNSGDPRIYNQSMLDISAYTGGFANRAYISVYQLTQTTITNALFVEYTFCYPIQ